MRGPRGCLRDFPPRCRDNRRGHRKSLRGNRETASSRLVSTGSITENDFENPKSVRIAYSVKVVHSFRRQRIAGLADYRQGQTFEVAGHAMRSKRVSSSRAHSGTVFG